MEVKNVADVSHLLCDCFVATNGRRHEPTFGMNG